MKRFFNGLSETLTLKRRDLSKMSETDLDNHMRVLLKRSLNIARIQAVSLVVFGIGISSSILGFALAPVIALVGVVGWGGAMLLSHRCSKEYDATVKADLAALKASVAERISATTNNNQPDRALDGFNAKTKPPVDSSAVAPKARSPRSRAPHP